MLRSHPYCGMYYDELTWGIYRTKMAPEPAAGDAANNSADFDKVLDVYFNSTQCIMPTRLFGDGRQGQPGAVAGVYALSHARTHALSLLRHSQVSSEIRKKMFSPIYKR